MSHKPLPVASEFASPALANLWATEKHIFVSSSAWRWTDTGFLVLLITLLFFILGLVCQDAELTVQLGYIQEGTWRRHIINSVMHYFQDGIREDALQKYIKNGLSASKARLKREIKVELREEYLRRQRKKAGGEKADTKKPDTELTELNTDPEPQSGEDIDEYTERLGRLAEEAWRREALKANFYWGRKVPGELVEISDKEARELARSSEDST